MSKRILSELKLKYLLISILLIGFFVGFFDLSGSSPNLDSYKAVHIQDKLSNDEMSPRMIVIPAGIGTIGGENFRSFQNEAPIFQVKIESPFALSETEITFEQYDLFCKTTGHSCPEDEGWGRKHQPVVNVSWFDAVAYTKWLSSETGNVYRLPSEIEWEYAARGGTDDKFWWGNTYKQGIDHCDRDLGNCPKGTDAGHPWRVKTLNANPFGLFDMTSNVSEWVNDCYSDNRNVASEISHTGFDNKCREKVTKGANWMTAQPYVHHSLRIGLDNNYISYAVGFRVLREIKKDDIKE
ncbi:formylglycine-generating enzyme family protein [Pseudoalteromonas sp. N1230-9]|uniref:formylglycine-generating enzyme family protein n=1 Tax=Pseudoalteromonas sp. N1230-9 TaxID=2907156 RepID=UPI002B311A6F|nr:formylglycine-generating enzyme family protein [Pseudoalteromonas sp. N1230-9]